MPARPSFSIVLPARFDPGWSLLGRVLRRRTGDRLRAEALHLVVLTAGALGWLMGAYAAEALAPVVGLSPTTIWIGLGVTGTAFLLVGVAGVRPRTLVTYDGTAVCVERGRERLRLPCNALTQIETVSADVYHRHYRRYARVRPFLSGAGEDVLLLHQGDDLVVALGLPADQRTALREALAKQGEPSARLSKTVLSLLAD